MITYEELKEWFKEPENKKKLFWVACAAVMFFVGLGTGRYTKPETASSKNVQSNYTTKKVEKPVAEAAETVPARGGEVAGTTTPTTVKDCPVKGNIGSGGKKIYHVKGGAFYDRTKEEQCFNTPAEAEAAGFTKSQR